MGSWIAVILYCLTHVYVCSGLFADSSHAKMKCGIISPGCWATPAVVVSRQEKGKKHRPVLSEANSPCVLHVVRCRCSLFTIFILGSSSWAVLFVPNTVLKRTNFIQPGMILLLLQWGLARIALMRMKDPGHSCIAILYIAPPRTSPVYQW